MCTVAPQDARICDKGGRRNKFGRETNKDRGRERVARGERTRIISVSAAAR